MFLTIKNGKIELQYDNGKLHSIITSQQQLRRTLIQTGAMSTTMWSSSIDFPWDDPEMTTEVIIVLNDITGDDQPLTREAYDEKMKKLGLGEDDDSSFLLNELAKIGG